MNVYDERRDCHRNLCPKLYEGVSGGLAKFLENAARGRIGNTQTSQRMP
jgi:hypothetical protein